MNKLAFPIVLSTLLAAALAVPLAAQNPAELGPRDKTEVFIQHLVKVAKIDPAKYRALVLEYEIGNALTEIAHAGHASPGGGADADHDPEGSCCAGLALGAVDFIQNALKEIHPEYLRALELAGQGKTDEARQAAADLAGKLDPYLAAHANLLLSEIDYDAAVGSKEAAAFEKVVARCERLGQKDRLYLIQDHRACELIALAFGKMGKPIHEFLQYAILLTDYADLPADVAARAKERLDVLQDEAGRPIGAVASWMNKVEKLLAKEITSKEPTQSQEIEIVSALDKLIELQEARERRT